ncbi:hypothetical protein [Domibacillus iocasae]|uniref:Uncharacterized protein n=1 Tax=Domibacillus iocasae TaxID=1714016 RepID=A0A1E7DLK3_9BACI|nr:hypothetical protein [Domibacillus iocasae]OES43885.1 hypothetical protein BA724_12400 [Domibacillus iocasae]
MPDGEVDPQIIADRGDALLLYPNDQGRVYIKAGNVLYPAMHYEAILKFGYWEEYRGENNAMMIDRYEEK